MGERNRKGRQIYLRGYRSSYCSWCRYVAEGYWLIGKGIGVDSGLPDYRGPSGFWKGAGQSNPTGRPNIKVAYPQLCSAGLSLEEMSHPDWFINDPKAAWGFYSHRASLYLNANPHSVVLVYSNLIILGV